MNVLEAQPPEIRSKICSEEWDLIVFENLPEEMAALGID